MKDHVGGFSRASQKCGLSHDASPGFYALALPDEGTAQAIAGMDYATPHMSGG